MLEVFPEQRLLEQAARALYDEFRARDPEMFAVAMADFADEESLNVQQMIFGILHRGAKEGRVVYVSGSDFLYVFPTRL